MTIHLETSCGKTIEKEIRINREKYRSYKDALSLLLKITVQDIWPDTQIHVLVNLGGILSGNLTTNVKLRYVYGLNVFIYLAVY